MSRRQTKYIFDIRDLEDRLALAQATNDVEEQDAIDTILVFFGIDLDTEHLSELTKRYKLVAEHIQNRQNAGIPAQGV